MSQSITRPLKRNREAKRLIDALGGGMETNTPRSARTARKLPRKNSTLSSSSSSSPRAVAPTHHRQKELTHKHSDSSLSELSDSFDPPIPTISLSQEFEPPPITGGSSLPSTPSSNYVYASMKTSHKNSASLRKKTIIKRSNFSFVRAHQPHKSTLSRSQRNRKLTDSQKRELEQTRIKLLKNLEKEEELIKTSRHPILISLEENVKIGKEIKLNQARQKFDHLLNYLNALHFERQQRIWDTCMDKKIRLRNDMIVDCQIRLNRAPFEFLISSDTTNLQAIFHLTPTPTASYNRPKLSVNQELNTIEEKKSVVGILPNPVGKVTEPSYREETRNFSKSNKSTSTNRKGEDNLTLDARDEIKLNHRGQSLDQLQFMDCVDLIDGLIHHKIRNHNVWQLSNHDVDHDLKLIKKSPNLSQS